MNTNLTEIAFVLDRSGSMEPLVPETIAGFNRFLRDQQALPGQARFSLVLFDDQIETPVDALPIAEVVALDTTTFTADEDGIGSSVDSISRKSIAMRRLNMRCATMEDNANLQKSTTDILREEEAKRKKGR